MIRTALLPCLAAFALTAQDDGNQQQALLKSVENRYNHARTLEVRFHEMYKGQGRPRQEESGQLTLRKPGRMRWDYSLPAGKLFVSDGKNVFLYTPDNKRVEKMPLKESDDMRAPLAFLLGKLDFGKEFRNIQSKPDGDGYLMTADAKSDKLPYDRIQMWIARDYSIRKLIVDGQDKTVLTFEFADEKLNPGVSDALFRFQMPAGATLVNQESGQ